MNQLACRRNWQPWHVFITVRARPTIVEQEFIHDVVYHGKFIWESKLLFRKADDMVHVLAPCIWPDFSVLHQLCLHLVKHVPELKELEITIFRDRRIRKLVWNQVNNMSIMDMTLIDPITANDISSCILALDSPRVNGQVTMYSMWLEREKRMSRPRRWGRGRHPDDDGSYWGDDSMSSDYDPYILEAGPFDPGW